MAKKQTALNAGDVKRTELYLIAPSQLVCDWSKNGRRDRVSDADVAAQAASIKEHGQLQPIKGRRGADNRVEVVFGFTRYAAGLLIEREDPAFRLAVDVIECGEEEAFVLNVIENLERNATTQIDNAVNMKRLMDEHGYTHQAVCDLYKLSTEWVRRHLKALELPEAVQARIASGELSLSVAVEKLSALSAFDAEAAVERAAAATPEPDAPADAPGGGAASKKKPRKIDTAALCDAVRDAGAKVARTAADLKRFLSDREDPISLALKGYLTGDVSEETLAKILDDAEPPLVKFDAPAPRPRKAKAEKAPAAAAAAAADTGHPAAAPRDRKALIMAAAAAHKAEKDRAESDARSEFLAAAAGA
jgi:ParB/RepB/Spo0J family partition protein